MGYDYVKGYKSPMSSLPKNIREIVKKKMMEDSNIKKEDFDFDDIMYEIDVYVSVDVRNYYNRK